jgi:putative ABC transport system permease protein
VEAAGAINHLPLAGDEWGTPYRVEGQPIPPPGETPRATYRAVLPGYLETMGIEMLQGRAIRESDDLAAGRIVVVNHAMAARWWPNEDPIGKRIALSASDEEPDWLTVIGVVKNTVRSRWAEPPEAEVYLPYLQDAAYLESPGAHRTFLTFVMRTSGNPHDYVQQLRSEVHALDRNVAVSQVITMREAVAQATTSWRFPLLLLAAFATVALVLAAIGVYGLMSYTVTLRSREIGIRVALGAARRTVLGMIVTQTMRLVLIGTATGLLGALILTRLMASMLYGVGAGDPATFVVVALLLFAVALCASALPALRAVRGDPVSALREG